MSGQANFFDQVTQYFNEAAKFTTYPEGLLEQIRVCNSVYRFDFPLRRRRRQDRGHSRLAGPAQPSQDAGQGRHSLQPRRLRRRGDGARRADDLQVRHRRRPVWRRQGRHQDRAQELLRSRSWSASPAVTRTSWRRRTSSAPASTCRRPTTAPASARWRGLPTPTPRSTPDSWTRSAASPASRSRRAACAAARKPPAAACTSRSAKPATNRPR